MPVRMSSKTAPMKARASCSPQTISAMRHSTATSPLDGSTERTVPEPAQPEAPMVLGGQWISA
eukprot:1592977-Pyramimonas_sp.AAC.1